MREADWVYLALVWLLLGILLAAATLLIRYGG